MSSFPKHTFFTPFWQSSEFVCFNFFMLMSVGTKENVCKAEGISPRAPFLAAYAAESSWQRLSSWCGQGRDPQWENMISDHFMQFFRLFYYCSKTPHFFGGPFHPKYFSLLLVFCISLIPFLKTSDTGPKSIFFTSFFLAFLDYAVVYNIKLYRDQAKKTFCVCFCFFLSLSFLFFFFFFSWHFWMPLVTLFTQKISVGSHVFFLLDLHAQACGFDADKGPCLCIEWICCNLYLQEGHFLSIKACTSQNQKVNHLLVTGPMYTTNVGSRFHAPTRVNLLYAGGLSQAKYILVEA